MNTPKISVIILNYNGKKWLKPCLESWKKVSYKPLEIIVVDNDSDDDSVTFLKKNYPWVKLHALKENTGYAKGNNIGVKAATGKYVVLLNNDTKLTPHFLDVLVKDLENDPSVGIVQPQMRSLMYPDLLDSVVSYFNITGFLYHFGYMKPHKKKKYNKLLYGYSIKGACFMMRKKEYLSLGGLDEDFFIYVEETDLCHRVWLSGKKVVYDPRSVMYHWGGGDTNAMGGHRDRIVLSYRNRIYSYIKNFSLLTLCILLPLHLLFCFGFISLSLIKGKFSQAFAALEGLAKGFYHLPEMLAKRTYIQNHIRKVSDREYFRYVYKMPRLSYFYYFFSNPKTYKD